MTFIDSSREIVRKFLSTVVVVDDDLKFEVEAGADDVPDDFDDIDTNPVGLGQPAHNQSAAVNTQPQDHPLNYQELSLSFAEHSILCSAFRPLKEEFETVEAASDKISSCARRADIVILDWNMDDSFGEEPGKLARESILKIVEQDKQAGGRLRLLVVYTGEPDTNNISLKICEKLSDFNAVQNPQDELQIDFEMEGLKYSRIIVAPKVKDADSVRDLIFNHFSALTRGLLPNATLSAISDLRDQTHQILHAFNNSLDSAYMSHVIGLLSSDLARESANEVAFDYAADLISEEIKSILQTSQSIKSSLNQSRLKSWLVHLNAGSENDFFELKVDANRRTYDSPEIEALIDSRSKSDIVNFLTTPPRLIPEGTNKEILRRFEQSRIEFSYKGYATDSHEQLSILECKRRDMLSVALLDDYEPNIKLGSILEEEGTYYVCLQPLCDSVRIRSDKAFIFLKAEVVEGQSGFTHVIRGHNRSIVKLRITPTTKKLIQFQMRHISGKSCIVAEKELKSGRYCVKRILGDDKDKELCWVGELKTNIAQSLSNQVAYSISRIGLDMNEWLRLSGHSQSN